MRLRALALSALLVVSLVGAAAVPAAGQQAEGEAYAGTHVEFEQRSNAVANYAVGGDVLVENVTMQSASEARSQAGIGAGANLGAAADIAGAAVESRTEAGASVTLGFESGGQMQAHDTQRGVVQFEADGEDQIVEAEVSPDAEAEAVSDKRVVVTREDGTQGAFIVVGEGEAVVNEEGNVTAEIAGEGDAEGELVYRQYDDERSEDDEEAERMIAEGTATAEVYVQQAGDDGEGTAVEAIEYGEDTAVEVQSQSRDTVEMTVERTESDGRVVLTTVSEAAFENAEDIEVLVDGEAAARADSYSEAETAAAEGEEPRYHVAQSSSAEAAVDVVIGIDHFSERNVEMTSADDGGSSDDDGSSDDGGETTPGADADGAGFGVLAALVALAAALVVARRR